jgi:oxygen-dependent protoporphyrinogen oxidase
MQTYDCIIVGAGISGLSAAYELYRRGAQVLAVEARAEPGGSIRSERTSDGFVFEHGPNTVVNSDPAMFEQFDQLGIADLRLTADRRSGNRYVVRDGEPTLLPSSPGSFLNSPILSPAAKLRLLAEPLFPRAPTSDESVSTFFSRRFGTELAEQLVDPFVSGVYAGDPRELSMQETFGKLWQAEQRHGSVVVGMLAGTRSGKPKPKRRKRRRSQMISFQDGLRTWPEAIGRALGPRLSLNTRATRLQPARPTDGGARGQKGWLLTVEREGREETLHAMHIILALPAYASAALLDELEPVTARALRGVPYSPVAIVHLAYHREQVRHSLDGFGMLCPGRERRRILGTLWPSSLFAGRVPDNTVLLTTFVGGARAPQLAQQDDESLIEMVAAEQQALVGAEGEPLMARVIHWERAIPQYIAGHTDRMCQVEHCESILYGLHLLGGYRGGVSVERCWHNGRDLGINLPLPSPAQQL